MSDELSLTQKAGSWPAQVKNYIEDLHLEMKQVTWPSWKQVRGTTGVVIVAVFAFAAYFRLVDEIVARAISRLFAIFAAK